MATRCDAFVSYSHAADGKRDSDQQRASPVWAGV